MPRRRAPWPWRRPRARSRWPHRRWRVFAAARPASSLRTCRGCCWPPPRRCPAPPARPRRASCGRAGPRRRPRACDQPLPSFMLLDGQCRMLTPRAPSSCASAGSRKMPWAATEPRAEEADAIERLDQPLAVALAKVADLALGLGQVKMHQHVLGSANAATACQRRQADRVGRVRTDRGHHVAKGAQPAERARGCPPSTRRGVLRVEQIEEHPRDHRAHAQRLAPPPRPPRAESTCPETWWCPR